MEGVDSEFRKNFDQNSLITAEFRLEEQAPSLN